MYPHTLLRGWAKIKCQREMTFFLIYFQCNLKVRYEDSPLRMDIPWQLPTSHYNPPHMQWKVPIAEKSRILHETQVRDKML